ncbi:MAG: peptidoglycan -binding protein [Alphaproteobacteria bacterium]
MALSRRRVTGGAGALNVWPGWVDALSALLMVVIFVLLIFMLAQGFLKSALTGRDQALAELNTRIAALADELAVANRNNEELRTALSGSEEERAALGDRQLALSEEIQGLKTTNTDLNQQLNQRINSLVQLEADIAALQEVKDKLETDLAAATLLADRSRELEADRDAKVKELELSEEQRQILLNELGTLRDKQRELGTELAEARDLTLLRQKEIEERDIQVSEANKQLTLLNRQIEELRTELARLTTALDASEATSAARQLEIDGLNERLNKALVDKVEQLAKYRSDFFGRLREVLGDREDIRIEGDRFVFQSEVLFASGEAQLGQQGQDRLREFAETLTGIASEFPDGIDWVLRVDGHTDIRPIRSDKFPSNWELSTARAVSVVKYLAAVGVPNDRLVAAGFGPYQPLVEGQNEQAWTRNRRIELRLDQK